MAFLLASPVCLVERRLRDVETQDVRVQVNLVLTLHQDLCNVPRILKLPQIHVRPRLLDGVTNELGRSCLTLCADDCGLLLLTRLVDDEGSPLCFLLGDLLGFDGSREFGGEGEVLDTLANCRVSESEIPYRQRHII
jgi:hypothetical protein